MATPSEPSSSREQAGRGYIKIRDIGQGSYGKAVLVHDSEGKSYVMKIIEMTRMDTKQRKDTINEVKVLSSLKHPYIISYRESYIENRSLVIIMDYAEGGDLHQRITKTRQAGKTFSEERVLRWFTEGTLALKYLHDKHVLHRDLKSQNLFLTAQDRLRIGDFGISKVLESTGAFARTAIGTPYYLSPEICLERPYSFSSDIWALGCVLYELAALRVPFDAQSLQKLVQKITRGPAPVLPPNYSAELKQLCGDLLHRDESQRPCAVEILQRPIVQNEIRRMLREEQAKGSEKATDEPYRRDGQSSTPCMPGMAMVHRRIGGFGAAQLCRKTPSLPIDDSRGEESQRGREPRHSSVPPAPLKGVGASVCADHGPGARARDMSPGRGQYAGGYNHRKAERPPAVDLPRDAGAGTPSQHGTPGGMRRRLSV
mmetsp:Transcript_112887/g.319334  ORF Transcript_112887/g.319334 Transcript_112887/m.319334 type:complete len:428 (+) Transcript_112887:246-1529(+)